MNVPAMINKRLAAYYYCETKLLDFDASRAGDLGHGINVLRLVLMAKPGESPRKNFIELTG